MDLQNFMECKFERRTALVPVSASLSAFFNLEGKTAVRVQSLTGHEVAVARERVRQNAAISALVKNLVSQKAPSKVAALNSALGLSDDATDDEVYRIAVCESGVISTKMPQEKAVKLLDVNPEAFYSVTSKILELTGLGKVPMGESNASGTTQE